MGLEGLIVLLLSLLLFAAVARSFKKGRGVSRTFPSAGMLRVKAFAGSGEARYRLGILCLEKNDDVAGFDWLLKSAESGNLAAQDAVGMMYELGRGVPIDYGEAARWYAKAASRGFVDSEVNLGNLYALGRGVERDYIEAAKWLEEAASSGGRQARNSLSWLLATCPDSAIRNGRRAIAVLSPVVNRGERHPVLLDTLAAAFAETGRYEEALRLVREALFRNAQQAGDDLYRQMKRHEAFYKSGKPWREPPQNEETVQRCEADEEATQQAAPLGTEASRSGEDSFDGALHSDPLDRLQSPSDEEKGRSLETSESQVSPLTPSPLPEGAAPPDDHASATEDGSTSQSHVDYIVEKLLVIEQLLRPLKPGESEPCESTTPDGSITAVGEEASGVHKGGQPLPVSTSDADQQRQTIREFADLFATSLCAGDYGAVYASMDKAFRRAVPMEQMGPMIQQMYETYGGRPVEAEFQEEEQGYKMHGGVRTTVFWYALRGIRYEKGTYVLFMEVLPSGAGFVCSGFFILPGRASEARQYKQP